MAWTLFCTVQLNCTKVIITLLWLSLFLSLCWMTMWTTLLCLCFTSVISAAPVSRNQASSVCYFTVIAVCYFTVKCYFSRVISSAYSNISLHRLMDEMILIQICLKMKIYTILTAWIILQLPSSLWQSKTIRTLSTGKLHAHILCICHIILTLSQTTQ